MKKTRKAWMLGLIMFCICSIQAQVPGYIKGDENYTLTLAFHKVDTLLVVVPHNYKITDREKAGIENYVFWGEYQKEPVYTYKTEFELTPGDESKNLQFYGPFCDFKLPEIQNIPVKQVDGGFSFNNKFFTEPTDAFFYINDQATRLYTCRNSTQEFNQYTNFSAGYFQLYVFKGVEPYMSGFCSSNATHARVNDLSGMRQDYFETVATRHFDFKLAKPLCNDSLKQVILSQADKFLVNTCATLKTDTLNFERMTTYVYNSMPDLQKFLSMSPQMTIYGKSIGNINHVLGLNMGVFNHELAHTIIGRKVGIQSNSFFSEGFAVYTGYEMEDSGYSSDLDSTRNHLDLLNEEVITGPDNRFYSIPGMYPISGVFTRFIVDKIGIDTFKAIYVKQNIENAFVEKGFPLADLIAEFKNSLNEGFIGIRK